MGALAGMLPSQGASRFPAGAGMPSGAGVADRGGLPARRVRKPAPVYHNNKSESPFPSSAAAAAAPSSNNSNSHVGNNSNSNNNNIVKEREKDRLAAATPPDSLEVIGSKHKKNSEIQSYNDVKASQPPVSNPSSAQPFVPQHSSQVAGAPSYDMIDDDNENTLLEIDKLIGGSSAITAVLQQRISAPSYVAKIVGESRHGECRCSATNAS